jgi:hypothetical protein
VRLGHWQVSCNEQGGRVSAASDISGSTTDHGSTGRPVLSGNSRTGGRSGHKEAFVRMRIGVVGVVWVLRAYKRRLCTSSVT